MDNIGAERKRRDDIWKQLIAAGGPQNVEPQMVRDLGIYGGAAGIWADLKRTREIDPAGITVGLLHTGTSYADDLDEAGVLYHYPSTDRQGHDEAEINATKASARLSMPLFVITHSEQSKLRDVRRGFVVDWDDPAKIFLVSFLVTDAGQPLPSVLQQDETPFSLTFTPKGKKRLATVRDSQPAFKFNVLRRYGPKCAVCETLVLRNEGP